jgi:hypothetical protein
MNYLMLNGLWVPARLGIGKAYALFDCKNQYKDTEITLPDVQDLAETGLELELSKGVTKTVKSNLNLELRRWVSVDEPDLRTQLANFKFDYTLLGRLPRATNKDVAKEIKDVMNMMVSSLLFEAEEQIRMEIVYHDGHEWQQFRE